MENNEDMMQPTFVEKTEPEVKEAPIVVNEENGEKPSFKLDKKGIIILVISCVLALAFLITGIVLLTTNGKDASSDDNNKNDNSSINFDNVYYNTAYLDDDYTIYAPGEDYYHFKYYCGETAKRYICLDGGEIWSVYQSYNGDQGTKTAVSVYSSFIDGTYDLEYYFYAEADVTYYITVETESRDEIILEIKS